MPSKFFKSIDHFSTLFCFETRSDPAHTAGSRNDLTYCGAYFTLCLLACQQIFFYSDKFLQNIYKLSVEMAGFEPATFALQRRCSPTELHPQDVLGRVGLTGFEPVTPALSAQCSNQLSYKPASLYFNN